MGTRLVLLPFALMGVAACGRSSAPPAAPHAADMVGESGSLYAVDWPTSMRVDLDVNARHGLVVLALHEGGDIRVLTRCAAEGRYRVESVSPKEELVRFTTKEELSAKLPFSGAGIAAKADLGGAHRQVVDLAVVTRSRATAPAIPVGRPDLRGDCAGATHVVTAFQRGAFALAARSSTDVAASAEVLGLAATGSYQKGSLISKSDGDPTACRTDDAPGCDALLTIAVRPLAPSSQVTDPTGANGWITAACPNEEACDAACDAGDMDACAAASVHALTNGDYRRAERLGRAACDASRAHGCTLLGRVYDPLKATPGALHDAAKATQLYARGCELGSLNGCVLLSYYAQRQDPFRPQDEGLIELVARGCAGGNASSCSVVAGWYQAQAQWLARSSAPSTKTAFDKAIRFEAEYCKRATPTELSKQPCTLENWKAVRRELDRR
jgi:hypothetical protein